MDIKSDKVSEIKTLVEITKKHRDQIIYCSPHFYLLKEIKKNSNNKTLHWYFKDEVPEEADMKKDYVDYTLLSLSTKIDTILHKKFNDKESLILYLNGNHETYMKKFQELGFYHFST